MAVLRATWAEDAPAVFFTRNDLDAQRSGDAFLVPGSTTLADVLGLRLPEATGASHLRR